jgi:NAD(P)-dependent dehydrogenase (short-subunit alcohol dehydrogenase family)
MDKKPVAVMITGACKRIGFALTKQCLAKGYHVIAHYRTDKGELGNWIKSNSALKDSVHFIRSNLDKNASVFFREAASLPLSITGLVNNASVFSAGEIKDIAHFNSTVAVNSLAPLVLSNEFFARLGSGWIINITDACASSMNRTYQNYRISKLFLEELTRRTAFDFAPNVRVNAIAPGFVLPSPDFPEKKFKNLALKTPMKRAVHIQCIIRAFDYLIDNCCVTGEILHVDSGWHLKQG